ncbi:MAG TPA: hypothetical protein VHX60_18395 [Acidobacteriaceae bacterium]|nr:hypothetical protein [Acidobacteriaceae bacterium]
MRSLHLPIAWLALALAAGAQSTPSEPQTDAAPPHAAISIATVSVEGVSLSGSLSVADGRATIGNDGSITAGDRTADVALTRGGDLKVCASTKIHLSTDTTTPGGGLMIALDRGSFEAHYVPGAYSDVLLTPDFRILISGPGQADVSLRVNSQGDTCLDNHGDQAPYVLASSLFAGGAYRVQPNQRVLFEHGSLRDVVDNEPEPCGCPPDLPVSVASAGATGGHPAQPGEKVAAQNATAAQNPFPLAESEGLKPPSAPASTPEMPAGETHMEVTTPLAYDANHPEAPPAESGSTSAPEPTADVHSATAEAPPAHKPHTSVFRHIGHFFRRLFGG